MNIKILVTILLMSFCFYTYKCSAFLIPDISNIGKDPVIKAIKPEYLIPGKTIKIYGENFYESPKSANKIFINSLPARILSVSKEFLEIKIPSIKIDPTKEIEIKVFTNYLGYKSKEYIYPGKDDKPLFLTFPSPKVKNITSFSVKPDSEIILEGDFKKIPIFIKVKDDFIEGRIISKDKCSVILPKTLPGGPFKITTYYRKELQNGFLYSAPSNEFVLYNTYLSNPLFLKINIDKSTFRINDSAKYNINLYFNNLSVDITDFCDILVSDESIFKINKKDKTIKPIKDGSCILKANFLWLPNNTELSYSVQLSTDFPQKPSFHEITIDEIFPFATGLIKETDANMDGFAKTSEDEFIELKNNNDKALDISGCEFYINESDKPAYKFPNESFLNPKSYLAIFSSKEHKLNLSNSAGVLEFNCNGTTIDYTSYPTGKNGDPSWQRKDDLSGFIKHPINLFSPNEPPPITPPPSPSSTIGPLSPSSTPNNILDIDSTPIPTTDLLQDLTVIPAELNFTDRSPFKIDVIAEYSSQEKVNVTENCIYKVSSENIISVDKGHITPIKNGTITLEITFQDKSIELIININFKSKVKSKELIINEILSAPTTDTNKDGVFKSDQDEFIEIINISGNPLDIGDLTLSDNTRIRHTFPTNTILQNLEPIIVFGGGNINGFSLSKSQIADNGSLGLNNTGAEQITIATNDGLIIDQVNYDNNNVQGISLNRLEDTIFKDFISHDKFFKAVNKYSPGTRIDGSGFNSTPPFDTYNLKGSSSGSSSGAQTQINPSSSSGFNASLTTSSSSGN